MQILVQKQGNQATRFSGHPEVQYPFGTALCGPLDCQSSLIVLVFFAGFFGSRTNSLQGARPVVFHTDPAMLTPGMPVGGRIAAVATWIHGSELSAAEVHPPAHPSTPRRLAKFSKVRATFRLARTEWLFGQPVICLAAQDIPFMKACGARQRDAYGAGYSAKTEASLVRGGLLCSRPALETPVWSRAELPGRPCRGLQL